MSRLNVLGRSIAVVLLAAACAPPVTSRTPESPTSLSATPALVELPVGGGTTLTVVAAWPDGRTEDVTTTAKWTSSDAVVARASGNMVTGVSIGAATVTASYGGKSVDVGVTVVAARLKSLVLDPTSLELPVGADGQLTAKGTWTDGSVRTLGEGVDWSTTDATVVSLDIDNPGHVVARAAGRASLRARFDGLEASALVTVLPSLLKSLEVSAPSTSLPLGLSQPLTALGTFADGSRRDLTDAVTWSSSDAAVLAISNEPGGRGTVTAKKSGSATVTARMNYIVGTLLLEVTDPVVSLTIAPASQSVAAGRTAAFTVQGTDASGDTHDATSSVTWAVDDKQVAQDVSDASHPGLIRGLASGLTTVRATLGALSADAMLTVTAAVVDRLAVEPAEATFAQGRTLQLSAVRVWSDGRREEVTGQANWTSSASGVVDFPTTSGLALGKAEGTSTVTASLDTWSATAALTVGPAVLERIDLDAPVATLHAGVSTKLTATGHFSDGADRPLSDVVWSVDDTTKGAITIDGRVTAAAAGSGFVVRATKDGLTGTKSLAVSTATPSGLRVVLVSTSLPAGASTTATATLDFNDTTYDDVTAQALWTSSNEAVATASAGKVEAKSTGSTTIGAALLGQSGSASFTVTPPAITGIELAAPKTQLAADESVVLVVQAVRSDGTKTAPDEAPTFGSSAPAVIAVDASGNAAWVSPGKATLTATSGAFTATLELVAVPRAPSLVALSAAASKVRAGETLALKATASFTIGADVDATADATWTSSDTAKATVAGGVVTGVAAGSVTITATYLGVPGTFTVEVTKACAPVINEVQTYANGGGDDEFIELFNPCPLAIDLSGTKVAYRSAAGSTDASSFTFPASTVLTPGAFVLLTGSNYGGPSGVSGVVYGAAPGSGLSSTGGGLQWRKADGTVWDSFGWGSATNAYVEGTVAPKATDSTSTPRSIARKTDGVDTGDNLADFAVTKSPTPGATNVIAP
jgi:hypothetical protein